MGKARTLWSQYLSALLASDQHESESEVAQSCPTIGDPMDYSLPGSSVHGIFQAMVKNPSANAGDAKDMCSIPGLGRSPGVGNEFS